MDITDNMKQQVSKFLPDALEKAMASYSDFLKQEKSANDEASKNFEHHHKACKAGMAHIELLMKLADKCGLPDARVASYSDQLRMQEVMEIAKEDCFNDREKYKDDD